MPTNAVHTTKRRQRRGPWQNHAVLIALAGALLGVLILTGGDKPPEPTALEQASLPGAHQIAAAEGAAPDADALAPDHPASDAPAHPSGITMPARPIAPTAAPTTAPTTAAAGRPISDPLQAKVVVGWLPDEPAPRPSATTVATRPDPRYGALKPEELHEMERLLARLDLDPGTAEGVVDWRTRAAIRSYQEIAGLPVNGAPSRALLDDLREVVRLLDAAD